MPAHLLTMSILYKANYWYLRDNERGPSGGDIMNKDFNKLDSWIINLSHEEFSVIFAGFIKFYQHRQIYSDAPLACASEAHRLLLLVYQVMVDHQIFLGATAI